MPETKAFARDGSSNALINTQKIEHAVHRRNKEVARRLQSLEADINTLKNDLSEMSELLRALLRDRG